MFHRKAVVGGLLGGALGAILWALVVHFTQYEIGWIAWAVGGMVGYGVALGNRGTAYAPKPAGILAVVITLLAIAGGKFLAVQVAFLDDEELIEALLETTQRHEYTVSFLADEVVEDLSRSGRRIDWPPGVDPAQAVGRLEYPANVWDEAENRWAVMSEEERTAFRGQVDATIRNNLREQLPMIRPGLMEEAFLGSFGAMDLLFFGLAVVTAFGLAAGTRKTKVQLSVEVAEAVKTATMEVILAGGEPGEDVVRVAREVCHRVGGIEVPEGVFVSELALAQGDPSGLTNRLRQIAPFLNERGKGLIIQGAVAVAAADGVILPGEKEVIRRIGEVFGVPEDQLPSLLAGLQEGSPA